MVSAQKVADTLVLPQENKEYFDADIATQEYINTLSPEQKIKSDAYFEGGYWIMFWQFIIEIVIAWIFLSLGLSKWIKRLASKPKRINIQNLVYVLMYLLFAYLISFPFNVYTAYFREHLYGLSNMTFTEWFSEEMINLVLSLIMGSILIILIYMVMRKVTKQWWIWGSAVVIVFLIIILFITPVYISPLFNDYKPLEEGRIKEDILSIA